MPFIVFKVSIPFFSGSDILYLIIEYKIIITCKGKNHAMISYIITENIYSAVLFFISSTARLTKDPSSCAPVSPFPCCRTDTFCSFTSFSPMISI